MLESHGIAVISCISMRMLLFFSGEITKLFLMTLSNSTFVYLHLDLHSHKRSIVNAMREMRAFSHRKLFDDMEEKEHFLVYRLKWKAKYFMARMITASLFTPISVIFLIIFSFPRLLPLILSLCSVLSLSLSIYLCAHLICSEYQVPFLSISLAHLLEIIIHCLQ